MPFAPVTLSPAQERLRAEVREFLAARAAAGQLPAGPGDERRRLAGVLPQAGRAGLGRHDHPGALRRARAGAGERFIVVEELLAAGAPVGAHWIADRQTGPTILAYGTEEQRQRFLPAIARRRVLLLDRHVRARRRLRPGRGPHRRPPGCRAAGR